MPRLAIPFLLLASLALASTPSSARADVSPDTRRAVTTILEGYEALREGLAADQPASVPAAARQVAEAAQSGRDDAPEALRAHFDDIARAAQRLRAAPRDDLSRLRRLFGQLSRPVVALLSAEPSLRGERQIHECPMAQGYPKWVQASGQRSNPYMGTRMPRCGRPSRWAP